MTVSERTRLLPLQENQYDVKEGSLPIRRSSWLYFVGVIALFVVSALLFSSRRIFENSNSPEFYLDDSLLQQWDVWRSEASRTMTSLGDGINGVIHNTPNVTREVQNQVSSDLSQLGTWWDGTASTREQYVQGVQTQAQRFGDQVKMWWDDAAVTSERAMAHSNLTEKVQAIEKRFQHWWARASMEERAWWNATERQLQVDGQRGGQWLHQNSDALSEQGSEWFDAAKAALQKDSEKVAQAGVRWFNESSNQVKTWEGEVMDSSKKALSKDGAVATQVGKEWLNGTETALQRSEEKVADAFQSEEQIAKQKGLELWNDTEQVLKGEEVAASEQAHHWWNSVKDAANEKVVELEDEEHVLWNASQMALRHDRDAAEQRFALWWSTTKAYAGNQWHHATHQEEEWWNATEVWFHDHIALLPPPKAKANIRSLLYLNDTYAYSLLMNGYHWLDYSSDFFLLQTGWDVQVNQGYCAIASAAAVLNSFRSSTDSLLPVDPIYSPFAYATQNNLFNHCVQKTVVHRNATYDGLLQPPGGLSLRQLQVFLQCHNLNATLKYVNPANVSVDNVRHDLREALMNPQQRVIVNFDRPGIGQEGGGHFSPLGSYAPKQDAFLLMDVAKYKYPPVWIPTERLYFAMAMEDGCGDWPFPTAQDKLTSSTYPNSSKQFERILRRLKCQNMFRGYIVVQLPV